MKKIILKSSVLCLVALLAFSCTENEPRPVNVDLEEESSRLPAPAGRKIFISITENVPDQPEVKVYFDQPFTVPVQINVVTSDNLFSEGAGTYLFQPGQTAILRNIAGDLETVCDFLLYPPIHGVATRTLTLEIDKIYVNNVVSNHPVHIGSATHTLSASCNDVDDLDGGLGQVGGG